MFNSAWSQLSWGLVWKFLYCAICWVLSQQTLPTNLFSFALVSAAASSAFQGTKQINKIAFGWCISFKAAVLKDCLLGNQRHQICILSQILRPETRRCHSFGDSIEKFSSLPIPICGVSQNLALCLYHFDGLIVEVIMFCKDLWNYIWSLPYKVITFLYNKATFIGQMVWERDISFGELPFRPL